MHDLAVSSVTIFHYLTMGDDYFFFVSVYIHYFATSTHANVGKRAWVYLHCVQLVCVCERVFQSLTRCCMLGEMRLSGMKRWTPPGQEKRGGEGDRMSQHPEITRRRKKNKTALEVQILKSQFVPQHILKMVVKLELVNGWRLQQLSEIFPQHL